MNQVPTSFSIWDSSIICKSSFGNIETEKTFQDDFHSYKEELSNKPNLNKYKPYTSQLPGVDEDCMRITFSIMEQISLVEKELLLNNSQIVHETYNIGALIKSTLEDQYNSVSSRLMKLATILPIKGRDGPILVKWYKDNYQISTENAEIRAIRDFFSSAFCWQLISVVDPIILDTCGSFLCLTTAVDYVGSADDCQCGGIKNYLSAANDGIRSIKGTHVTIAIDDMIKACAFIRLKDFVTADGNSNEYSTTKFKYLSGTLTPSRFIDLRWWDAAIVPYYRTVIGLSSNDMEIKSSVDGTPLCVERCVRIKRTVDSIIRYNEMVDILSDVKIKERFNEVLVAFSMGGYLAIKGYAEAIASLIEDVLDCCCDADGHKWAASSAIGSCCVNAIYPRYQMLQILQMAATDKTANESDNEHQWGPFLSVQKCKLDNQTTLHSKDWAPGWRFEISTDNDISTYDVQKYPCSMCMLSAVALSVRILVQRCSLAIKTDLPTIIYELIGCSGKRDGSGHYQCVSNEAHSYAAIWQRICLNLYEYGRTEKAPQEELVAAVAAIRNIVESFCLAKWKPWKADASMSLSVQLYTSLDKAMRDTNNTTIVGDGIWRRQLLMGLVSSFLEFSPVRAYASVCEYAFGEEVCEK